MISRQSLSPLLLFLALPLLLLAFSPTRSEAFEGNALDAGEPLGPDSVHSEIPVTFRVVVERVTATNNFDGPFDWDRADFLARVRIQDRLFESPILSNDDDIRPGWQFSHPVNIDPATDTVSIAIEIWDSDDFGNRQLADLTADTGRSLLLSVNPANCLVAGTSGSVSGTVSGSCGQTLFSAGTAADNTAEIRFRVEAELPATAADLLVRCLHDPIWPQAGDTVEVVAEALDDSLDAKTVDEIEVWFGSTEGATESCTAADQCSDEMTAPASGNSMFYGCLVRDDGVEVWSGWRRVQVGAPPSGSAVPVVFTGSSSSRIDIVFVPDDGSYTNETDPAFLSDVRTVIYDAYYGGSHISGGADSEYGERLFLANQNKLNFWIATDAGIANGFPNVPCVQAPANWGHDYPFADAGAILHTDPLRDCAIRTDRIFSTEPSSSRTVLHETSHAPFGLADEYCCDSSYFEADPLPNIYGSLENCQSDLLALQVFDLIIGDSPRSNCRALMDGAGNANGYFTSEPSSADLMLDSMEYNGADVRRIEWGLERCASSDCGVADGGSPAEPVPGFDYASDEKVIVVEVDFLSRESLRLGGAGPLVHYGAPRAQFGAPPALRIDLFDTGGQLINQFNEWHPLFQSGSLYHDLSNPTHVAMRHDPEVELDEGTGRFVIPFSPDLATMRITDLELGETLLTVELLPAMETFCAANPDDMDCDRVGKRTYQLSLPYITR